MTYRKLCGTDMVSRLGIGCMRLPVNEKGGEKRVIDEEAIPFLRGAYEKGINYFDTAWTYCGGDSERAVGAAVKPFRKDVFISSKLPMWNVNNENDFWVFLRQSLSRLDTDYIDYYHFHSVNREFWNTIKRLELIESAKKARQMGYIRHISFSFHDQPELLKEIADTQLFDSVLCQYNILFTINEEAISYAKQKGLGVFLMNPLCGGNLALADNGFMLRFKDVAGSPIELGFKFVWGNPNVDCALSAMRTEEEIAMNSRYADQLDNVPAREWSILKKFADEVKNLLEVYCTDCQYCFVCPYNIRPSHIFKMYNNLITWGLKESSKRMYDDLCDDEWWYGNHPDHCIDCGLCAAKCPQNLPIPELLRKATAELKKL